MQLTTLDWIVVGGYGAIALSVGLYFARRAGRGTEDYFLAGRQLPWWGCPTRRDSCIGP